MKTLLATAVLIGFVASSASATTCDEYVALMRAEGVRTVLALGCGTEADMADKTWNEISDGPAGSCLASRMVMGRPEALALMVYMTDMNNQRAELRCPSLRNPGTLLEPEPAE